MSINNTSTLNFQQRTATMLEPNHMKFTPFKALVIAFILLGGNNLFAQDIILQDINYSNLDDNNIQIVLTLSGKAPKPGIFTIDNPARLAIDLPNTAMGLNKKSQQIDSSIARSIRAVEAGGRTRVVLNLNHMAPYDVVTDGNLIYINIGMDNAVSPTVVSTSPTEAQSELSGRTFSGKSISNINFHRSDSGGGKITVSLSDPSTIIDLQERAGKLVINFIGAHVPEKMERRLNVKDFATPVTAIDTYSREGNAHMVITAQGSYEHIAYQTGNTYTIDITPPKQTKGGTVDKKPEYTGERLSLNFQDIDVRAILQLLADFTSLNVIVSDSVQGNLTLRLKNVPWDHALDIILKTKGLAMRETGNVILIAPSAEIAAREKLELESQKQLEELAPLYTQYFEISYAKAAEIAALLKAEANSLLSSRGNVSIDDRTNTLMVLDTQDKIEDIQKLVDKLDIPIRQVLIESRIVIANDDYTRNLGVTLGHSYAPSAYDPDTTVTSSGLASGSEALMQNISAANSRLWTAGSNDLNVNLPIGSPAGQIALSVLSGDFLVDLELAALQQEGQGEVVSNPRVVTSNQNTATIEQGVEIPYSTISDGTSKIEFKKATLSLEVTPQITPDESVIMDLTISKDSRGLDTQAGPSINTRSITTQVLVSNGDTVVLGGIYEQTKSETVRKVPFLGDIPILGYLFRSKHKTDDKAELLIFVTPKILKDGLQSSFE